MVAAQVLVAVVLIGLGLLAGSVLFGGSGAGEGDLDRAEQTAAERGRELRRRDQALTTAQAAERRAAQRVQALERRQRDLRRTLRRTRRALARERR